jgi:predicted nucleotidyltransferase
MGFNVPIVGMKRRKSAAAKVARPRRRLPGAVTATGPRASGLADALFSKVQQRVLGVLFGNPTRSFYATEIIRLAESGTGAVQRELARLAASGLVLVSQVGRQKHYQANADSPLFEELRGMSLKTFGLADVLREALQPMAPEIRAAFVYGSVAKKTDTSASDIDLMVISDTLAYGDLLRLLEVPSNRLGRRVAPTIYSLRDFRHRLSEENAFVQRVLSQPKLWLIGDEHVLTA